MICLIARRSATTEMGPSMSASSTRFLPSARPENHAQGFRERLGQIKFLHVELHPAGFDLRHIQDVVDHLEQIVPAGENVVAIFLILLRTQRPEHAAFHDLGKSNDGIERRAQLVAHIGEELGLGLIGFLGAVFFPGIFLGRSASSMAWRSSAVCERFRSITVARSRRSFSTSFCSCSLMRVMSVPTET